MTIESVTADAGAGGESFAVDTITGGVQVPYAKLMSGTDTSEELIGGDAANGLDVDVTRSALPTGASTSAKQDTGNTSLASIDGKITAVNTGAVVVSSSALPSGASTAAKQPALGTAGTASADVISVQGIASMTALKVDGTGGSFPVTDSGGSLTVDNGGTFAVQATIAAGATSIAKAEDVAAAGGDVGVPAMAIQLATPADTAADGDYAMLQMSAGRLWVDASGKTLTVASHAVTNAGTFATQVDGAALTALQLIDDPVKVDDAAFTPATSSVMMAGFEADEGSTDSVDEGDAGAARMTLDRKLITNPQPHTAGGLSVFMASGSDGSSILVATAQAAKASAGQVYGWYIYNPESAVSFVHFYNVAQGSVTVGTTNPLMTLAIPATSAANVMGAHGIPFDTAITVAATTTAGGNTAPATGVSLVLFYK